MSNTADKEAYLKKKQELLEELKKRKKQIIFQLKERYEQRKKVIPKNEAEKDIATSKLLAKVGPVLGLIGTLIAMSPALTGLSSGDISGMAYNMQVVFATTVVGLVISLIGMITLQFKQRWYAKDTNNLDYVAQILTQNKGKI